VGRKRGVTVFLSDDSLAKLEDLSREKGVSLSGLIRMAVREWLRRERGEQD